MEVPYVWIINRHALGHTSYLTNKNYIKCERQLLKLNVVICI